MAGIEQQVTQRAFPTGPDDRPRANRSLAAFRGLAQPDTPPPHWDALVRTIKTEVVPRLVLARQAALPNGSAPDPSCPTPSWPNLDWPNLDWEVPGADDIAEFASLLLRREADAASSYLADLRARGVKAEALYLDLLAPAARHLGDLWVEDLCSFTDVTIGLLRMQLLLHGLSPAFQAEAAECSVAHARRALLVPIPGDQHTFGLAMVADFFRRAGWTVWSGVVASRADLARMVRTQAFDLVGFSASCDRHLDALIACIRAVRDASGNRAVGVMVGGPVFVEHPEIATLVGADATAIDGRQAPVQAEALLAALAGCNRLDTNVTQASGRGEVPVEEVQVSREYESASRERESIQGLRVVAGVAQQPGRGNRRRHDHGNG